MKVLQIVETARRAGSAQTDEPVVWITHARRGAGMNLNVLLQGDAVHYATRSQTDPPEVAREIEQLVAAGVVIYFVADDAAERGIAPPRLIAGVRAIARAAVPALFAQHDQLWMW
jgi:hypothetical protein